MFTYIMFVRVEFCERCVFDFMLPKIAITMSSFKISIEPRETKYSDVSTSPRCTNVSPGGAWVVLNRSDKALKHKKNLNKIIPSLLKITILQF